ncbi:MAG: hypothetical protein LJE95_10725, partial [Acidobacteria bacterium]|nr:hypothetical protein [Acidobacteriota bacterium]
MDRSGGDLRFDLVRKGVIRVVYEDADEMLPNRQGPLMEAIDRELARGPVALVFTVYSARSVDRSVPAYWRGVTKRLAPQLCAMAITSESLAVRTAARGFSVANTL